jgi:ligand-binding sensor domain-containing protein/uncharacterized membrane protein YphA (DoxX/SURF4 family)
VFWRIIVHRPLICFYTLSVCLFLPAPALALDPSKPVMQYARTTWTQLGDSPRAPVAALAQTKDGYLWLGTNGEGLIRFDGVRFSKWRNQSTLPSQSVASLRASSDGALWIGTPAGLSRFKNNNLITYTTKEGLSAGAVKAIAEQPAGVIWVGTYGYQSGGLSRLQDGRIQTFGPDDGLAGLGLSDVYADHRGNLLVGGRGGLTRWSAKSPTVVFRSDPEQIVSIAETPDDAVWLVSSRGLLRSSQQHVQPYPLPGNPTPYRVLVDRDGALWIATRGQGIFHLHQQQIEQFTRQDGLSSDTVWALLEDAEGNIWAGTENGVDRFRERKVATLSTRERLSGDDISSVVATLDGGVCVGVRRTGLDCIENGLVKSYGRREGLTDATVSALAGSDDGTFLVATRGGVTVFHAGQFRSSSKNLGEVYAISKGRDQSVWLADIRKGLFRFRGGANPAAVAPERFAGKPISALLSDSSGVLWIGSAQGGATVYKDGVFKTLTTAQGLGSGYVAGFLEDHTRAIWAATEGGLSRYRDGRFVTLTTRNGMPCDSVQDILEDDIGYLWLRTRCGLVRAKQADLSAVAAGGTSQIHFEIFGASDGFRTAARPQGTTPRAAKSRDGRLWFATGEGLAVIDPKHIPRNTVPPPVHIEQTLVDSKPVDTSRSVKLPPTMMRLEINYTALSFTDPDRVFFRYKLDGFDPTWVDAGTRRQAFYTGLRPGSYNFRVIACNNDGVWNEAGAAFSFDVEAAFLQTGLFAWLSASVGMLFLWVVYYTKFHHSPSLPFASLVRAYPTGVPGYGLLLLRIAIGFDLVTRATVLSPLRSAAVSGASDAARLLEIAGGALLIAGLVTPLVGALLTSVVVVELVQRAAGDPVYASLNGAWQSAVLYFVVLASLTLLGPGAYSLDARLFGRRRITVIARPLEGKTL